MALTVDESELEGVRAKSANLKIRKKARLRQIFKRKRSATLKVACLLHSFQLQNAYSYPQFTLHIISIPSPRQSQSCHDLTHQVCPSASRTSIRIRLHAYMYLVMRSLNNCKENIGSSEKVERAWEMLCGGGNDVRGRTDGA